MNYVKLDLQEYSRLKAAEKELNECKDSFAYRYNVQYGYSETVRYYSKEKLEDDLENSIKSQNATIASLKEEIYSKNMQIEELSAYKNQPWYKKLFK